MKDSTQIKPISYLNNHGAGIEKDLHECCEPRLVAQSSAAKWVIMEVAIDEGQEQTIALLQLLIQGRRDIEEGRVVPAVDVFAQAEVMDQGSQCPC